MILVLLGTFVADFKRPLIEIEKLCADKVLSEEIIVQTGHTSMESPFFRTRPIFSPDELIELHEKASLVITHAGVGSIINALRQKKKVIAIARLRKYGEHVDDHQTEILEEFAGRNYIFPWREGVSLSTVLEEFENFIPSPYSSNKSLINNYLTEYINSL